MKNLGRIGENILGVGGIQVLNGLVTLTTLTYLTRVFGVEGWGNIVFEQTKTSSQFRGDTENDKELKEGVYFYKMEIDTISGEKRVKQGFIHVVK